MESGLNNNKGLGEVSFSSYLKAEEGNFFQKLTDHSSGYPNRSIHSSPEFPSSRSLQKPKADSEGEIGVFGAESYYNMKLQEEGPIIIDTACKHSQVDLLSSKTKSRPGTPSVSSEASWNSQTGLLRSYQRNPSRGIRQEKLLHAGKGGFFSGLSCSGSCSDKKSVYINPNVELGGLVHGREFRKERIESSARNNPMMLDGRKQLQLPKFNVKDEFLATQIAKFSVAKSGVQNLAIQEKLAMKVEEEDPRKSLDVFGSHILKKEVIEKNLERKLSMLSWDAIPKTSSVPTSSSVRSQVYEDGGDSDASSDLFEIENISASSTGKQRRHVVYEDDGIMCPYEPSETSIEWSVVTASAAEYSLVSDYDEKNLTENIRTTTTTTTRSANKIGKSKLSGDKDVQGSSLPSKLLGCTSQKAVGVAESAHRINNNNNNRAAKPQQPLRYVAPMPVSNLKADQQ